MTLSRVRALTVVGLVGTGLVHIQQWIVGYQDVPITGGLFLLQGIAAVVLAGWLYADDRDLVGPVASALLMLASLVALGTAYAGVFINVAERVLRPATALSIVTEVIALVGAVLLARGRYAARRRAEAERPRHLRPMPERPVLISAFYDR